MGIAWKLKFLFPPFISECSEGQVVLALPSVEVLSEAALSTDRRATVIHIMESSVISWMKQIKVSKQGKVISLCVYK